MRLGAKNFKDLMDHSFFNDMNWEKLFNLEI